MSLRDAASARPAGARLVELLREVAPQALAIVARRHRDFSAAEDAVQEALLSAARDWPERGLPDHPRAWIVHVATRRLTDAVRADVARSRREAQTLSEIPDDERLAPSPEDEPPRADDTLQLLFMCCHPALSRTSAIALTLRAIGGLTTAEIAAAFLVPEATMAQRISRAKQTLKERGATFDAPLSSSAPDGAERRERLGAVLRVLYLVFNEGYASRSGESLQRLDLSTEAIRLTRELRGLVPTDQETAGLLALMLLTDARRAARTDTDGRIVPLDEQDRTLWDDVAIVEGTAIVTEAIARGAVGAYQLQAAIAAVHAEAKRAEDTDWPQILALYVLLERMRPNPMVTLSRAVATAMVHGPRAGLAIVDELGKDPRLAEHHRLHAVRAHLHERAGEPDLAIDGYRRAASLTPSLPERDYLRMKMARLHASRNNG